MIANRGEIAVIIRAVRDAGLTSVAVCAGPGRHARHVRLAGESRQLDGTTSGQTSLSASALLNAARLTGAGSIHPGYGFLAGDAHFRPGCHQCGPG